MDLASGYHALGSRMSNNRRISGVIATVDGVASFASRDGFFFRTDARFCRVGVDSSAVLDVANVAPPPPPRRASNRRASRARCVDTDGRDDDDVIIDVIVVRVGAPRDENARGGAPRPTSRRSHPPPPRVRAPPPPAPRTDDATRETIDETTSRRIARAIASTARRRAFAMTDAVCRHSSVDDDDAARRRRRRRARA